MILRHFSQTPTGPALVLTLTAPHDVVLRDPDLRATFTRLAKITLHDPA